LARQQDVSILTVIRNALAETDGNVAAAARNLGCSRTAIYNQLALADANIKEDAKRKIS
jgi:transcriptional regulator of acetoin/glycerol metabolism